MTLKKLAVLAIGWIVFLGASEARASIGCADPNHSPPYNVSSTSANNVPINQCYLNSVGECLYNTANPASGAPSWNTGCPANVAGSNCCRWRGGGAVTSTPTPKPTDPSRTCLPPNIGIPFPFNILATNPLFASEYAKCKQAAGSNTAYICCVNPEDACKRSRGFMVVGNACPRPLLPVFGPVNNRICCKRPGN